MNTAYPKKANNHVGDCDRPRTRPRAATLCVGGPKGGPPTTSTSEGSTTPEKPTNRPRTEATCKRCGSTSYKDVPIHDGQSIRRDCAECNRTLGFPKWQSRTEETRLERVERLLGGGLRGKVRPASELLFDYNAATRLARKGNP